MTVSELIARLQQWPDQNAAVVHCTFEIDGDQVIVEISNIRSEKYIRDRHGRFYPWPWKSGRKIDVLELE